MLTPATPKQHPLKTPTRTRHKPGGQLPSNGGHLVMPATPRPTKTPMRSRRRSLAPTTTTNRLYNSNNNHSNSIVDYCTPTTTRVGHTPSSGRSKIRGVFRYRPLELDNESSSESTMNYNYLSQDKEQLPSPQESRAKRLKREEPTPLSIKGSQCITPPITPDKPVDAEVVVETEEAEDKIKVKETNSVATKVQEQSVAAAVTTKVSPQEPSKLLQKLPSFIPGNCNIKELLEMYGTKTSNSTNKATAITTNNDINNGSSITANNSKGSGSSNTKTLIPLIELD